MTTEPTTDPGDMAGDMALTALGDIDGRSNRRVLHNSDDVQALRVAAKRYSPELKTLVEEATKGTQGVVALSVRSEKNLRRLREKIASGKPPHTIADYLAARIVFDSPKAYRQVLGALRRSAKRILEDDDFIQEGKSAKGGYRAHNLQILIAEGFSAEVQLAPREIYEVAHQTHALYAIMRRPGLSVQEYVRAYERAVAINQAAWERYLQRVQSGSE